MRKVAFNGPGAARMPRRAIRPPNGVCLEMRSFITRIRARLIVADPREMPEAPDEKYPFLLLTGRGTVSQWHTQTRTSKSAVLRSLYPNQPYVEIHPSDAAGLGLINGDECLLRSRRGEIQVQAWIVATVRPGQVFVPMHYPQTNQLTLAHFDPFSRQPSYKDCAVAIEKGPRRPVLPRTSTVIRTQGRKEERK